MLVRKKLVIHIVYVLICSEKEKKKIMEEEMGGRTSCCPVSCALIGCHRRCHFQSEHITHKMILNRRQNQIFSKYLMGVCDASSIMSDHVFGNSHFVIVSEQQA